MISTKSSVGKCCGEPHPQGTETGSVSGIVSPSAQPKDVRAVVKAKTQILIYLIALGLCDVVIPSPITAMVLMMVLYQRPRWFRELVREVYGS